MRNTYINDNADVHYPFAVVNSLPFPLSCISGMGVCVYGGLSAPVYVSSLSITKDYVRVTVCTGHAILCTGSVTRKDPNGSAALINMSETLEVCGYICLGIIPDSAIGTYIGTFELDPSCIMNLPAEAYGVHTHIRINKNIYKLEECLLIEAAGLLQCDTSQSFPDVITVVADALDARLVRSEYVNAYNLVESVNNAPYKADVTDFSTALRIAAEDHTDIVITCDNDVLDPKADIPETVEDPGGAIVLTLDGTHTFPNCYGDDDEAITGGEA